MKKILFASIFFILTTLICHIANCGYFCRQILIGDDKALLAMASSLITVWGIVVGFSITAIGATIQISKLPIDWKFNLLKDHIGIALWPFFAMILISGIAPFVVLFSIESQVPIVSSPVTGWVTLGFFLQILLIISAISAAKNVYENLSLSKAIHETLKNFDLRKLNGLIKLHKESYLEDYDKRRQLGFLPLSSFTDIIRKKEIKYHDELSTVFTTLFRETIPFNFESGMREVSNWLLKKDLNEFDGYLQYRLVPLIVNTIRDSNNNPVIFKTRLYYFAVLIVELQNRGASLTASNSANHIFDLILEYGRSNTISEAIQEGKNALELLLKNDIKHKNHGSIFIFNLIRITLPLVNGDREGLSLIRNIIMEWYRNYINEVLIKDWGNNKYRLDLYLEYFKTIFIEVEKKYHIQLAISDEIIQDDLRLCVLILLRRLQEKFTDVLLNKNLDSNKLREAKEDFDLFDGFIEKLERIRAFPEQIESYKKNKYLDNPFTNINR